MENEPKIEETDWISMELEALNEIQTMNVEQLPGLKLEENKIYEIEIDFSKPFEKWQDPESKTVKKIIPVVYAGQKMNFWLNCANPLYNQLLKLGHGGQRKFKIVRIGQAKATRYNLVQ